MSTITKAGHYNKLLSGFYLTCPILLFLLPASDRASKILPASSDWIDLKFDTQM